jgi:hypothetical protein
MFFHSLNLLCARIIVWLLSCAELVADNPRKSSGPTLFEADARLAKHHLISVPQRDPFA